MRLAHSATGGRATVAGLGSGYRREGNAFEVSVSDAELDALIDRLRARGIGIRTIGQRRLTLEESFIHLVGFWILGRPCRTKAAPMTSLTSSSDAAPQPVMKFGYNQRITVPFRFPGGRLARLRGTDHPRPS